MGFHIDDCRETEIWFACLKVVTVHHFYLTDQSHIIFLTFQGSDCPISGRNKWLLLCSWLFTPGEDRFHRLALIRIFVVARTKSRSVRDAVSTSKMRHFFQTPLSCKHSTELVLSFSVKIIHIILASFPHPWSIFRLCILFFLAPWFFLAQIARSLYNGILEVAPLFSCSSLPQGRVLLALSIFCQLQENWYLQYWLVPVWKALCLWLLWGGQADVAVPAEGMDKLQCMVPVTRFNQSSGTLQVLWFRTLAKLKESVFPSQEREWAACSNHTWFPSWVGELAPSHLLQVLHALFGATRLSVLCLPWKPSCAEAIRMCSWCVKPGRGRRALCLPRYVWAVSLSSRKSYKVLA